MTVIYTTFFFLELAFISSFRGEKKTSRRKQWVHLMTANLLNDCHRKVCKVQRGPHSDLLYGVMTYNWNYRLNDSCKSRTSCIYLFFFYSFFLKEKSLKAKFFHPAPRLPWKLKHRERGRAIIWRVSFPLVWWEHTKRDKNGQNGKKAALGKQISFPVYLTLIFNVNTLPHSTSQCRSENGKKEVECTEAWLQHWLYAILSRRGNFDQESYLKGIRYPVHFLCLFLSFF